MNVQPLNIHASALLADRMNI